MVDIKEDLFPCKDCLVLPMCKSKMTKYNESYASFKKSAEFHRNSLACTIEGMFISDLRRECPRLESYIVLEIDCILNRIDYAYKFLSNKKYVDRGIIEQDMIVKNIQITPTAMYAEIDLNNSTRYKVKRWIKRMISKFHV